MISSVIASAGSAGGSSTPAAAIALAVVAGLLAALCAAWGVARWLAWEPTWAADLRHALAEGGLRCSETFQELIDWARLRR